MSGHKIPVDLVNESTHQDAIDTFALINTKSGVGNIHRVLANSPTVFKNFIGLSYALRYTAELDPLERELAICCVLKRHDGDYEFKAHSALARKLGASEEQVANLCNPSARHVYSERVAAILQFAEWVAASAAQRAQLADHQIEKYLSNRQRLELGMTLGVYIGMSHFTTLFDIPPEGANLQQIIARTTASAGAAAPTK